MPDWGFMEKGNKGFVAVAAVRAHGPGSSGLSHIVEREHELAQLERCLREASDGAGGAIVIEAPAGGGKSRVLADVEKIASSREMRVLRATGSELERSFPFGVAIQLFEPEWTTADRDRRATLSAGHSRLAAVLLDGKLPHPPPPSDHRYPVIHGLLWFAVKLAVPPEGGPGGPLAIVVDDIQWADRASLRFLAYLAARLADLPIALIVAVRPGEDVTDATALSALQNASAPARLRLAPLSARGIETLVRTAFPDADLAFVRACNQVAGGNPFLITELLSQVGADRRAPDAATAARLTDLAPSTIVDSVVARLGAMSPACRALATAVAVLGDRAPFGNATRLAGLQAGAASEAADALAAAQLLNPGVPLSFVHPVIRSAVLASMPPLARGRAHRHAAIIVRDDGAPIEVVAGHLPVSPAARDPIVVGALRVAACDTIGSGEHESAARSLERALAKQPPPNVYPELLAELGQAEALTGLSHAPLRLEKAVSAAEEPQRRAELALAQGRALGGQGNHAEAAAAFAGGLRELRNAETPLGDELSSAFISAAAQVPELLEAALERRREMLRGVDREPNTGQREALAQTVIHDSLGGGQRSTVRKLADLAWSDGALLAPGPAHDASFSSLTSALLVADELERDLEICDAALALARDRESLLASATASHSRAWALYERGQIAEAAVAAKGALDGPGEGSNQVRTAYGALACCYMLTGQLDRAERALTIVDDARSEIRYPFLVDVRAQLRLAQHRPREALADALLAGRVLESTFGVTNPGVVAWRSTAALAHLALGEPAAAEELAAEELELAERAEVTRAVIRNLRVLGLTSRGTSGIELLEHAARFAQRYPARLESMYALVDLGAALRRANKRAAARTPLLKGFDLSHRNGATALARRAETELAASGARSRRALLTGVDALTPSERRVAEFAGQGLTTRQMAEALFVTPKTIEFHLRHIYRKLDVNSRSQLTGLFTAKEGA